MNKCVYSKYRMFQIHNLIYLPKWKQKHKLVLHITVTQTRTVIELTFSHYLKSMFSINHMHLSYLSNLGISAQLQLNLTKQCVFTDMHECGFPLSNTCWVTLLQALPTRGHNITSLQSIDLMVGAHIWWEPESGSSLLGCRLSRQKKKTSDNFIKNNLWFWCWDRPWKRS